MGQFTNTGNGSVLIPDAPDPNPQDNKVITPSSQSAAKAGDKVVLDAAVNAGGSQIVHPADTGAGSGSSGLNVIATQTAPLNALPGQFIPCDPTGGSFNVTLPTKPVAVRGSVVEIKNIALNTQNVVTALCQGGDTTGGDPSRDIISDASGRFVYDGVSSWMGA